MNIQCVKKPGTVTIHPDGKVVVEGFEIENADTAYAESLSGCQEYFHTGAAWAMQQLAYAMSPEGQMKGAVD